MSAASEVDARVAERFAHWRVNLSWRWCVASPIAVRDKPVFLFFPSALVGGLMVGCATALNPRLPELLCVLQASVGVDLLKGLLAPNSGRVYCLVCGTVSGARVIEARVRHSFASDGEVCWLSGSPMAVARRTSVLLSRPL